MPPKQQRLAFVILSVACVCTAVLLALNALRDNIVYFYSPDEIAKNPPAIGEFIRLGGLVEAGSVAHGSEQRVDFIITDGEATVAVTYTGLLPNLFREGQGVVVEGNLTDDRNHFIAKRVLAKHDETYMPREVADALKKSGRWRGEGAPE